MHCENYKHHMNQKNQSSDNCQRNLEINARPNHPQSARESSLRPRPHRTILPKILREPRKCVTLASTTATRARGPAATRHFTTHENRLPILLTSPQPCQAQLRPPCPALPHPSTARFFVKALFPYVSDRRRSSGIVSDRLRSPVRTARHSRKIAEMFARFRLSSRQKSASLRVTTRHFAPLRGKIRPQTHVKKVSPPHLGIADTSNDWPKNVGINSMTAFSLNFGSPDSWRANRRASRSSNLCPSQESDVP